MINKKPLRLFQKFENGRFVKPIYKDYSFANIPATIYQLLTGEALGTILPPDCFGGSYPRPKKIVLFFIDSFGFLFWQKYWKKFKFLQKITQDGVVTPISALFPSTTAASVSTMSLGVLPSQHALYEWNLYIDKYDEVIQTLPFSPLGTRQIDKCLLLGHNPKYLLNRQETVFQKLANARVESYHVVGREFANSAYNSLVSQGATVIGFSTLESGLVNIKNILKNARNKTFISFYWGGIDGVAHKFGPGSEKHDTEIANFWSAVEYAFADFKKSADTLFLFTADHGSIAGDPAKTYYLNLEIPEIVSFLKTGKKGQVIYPNGAPRDVFLHVKAGDTKEVLGLLKQKLAGVARVMRTREAINSGLFGPPPYSKEFIKRLGQILILPYGGNYVWWYEKDKLENRFWGHHGGLAPEEMLTVLAAW